ncbi:hypothetical protein PHYBLDRAFT_174091 [Phycomyces blakesleeanus NRRL 1555(-)]|uniref:Transcription activator GCR1-like domain-containing protein n=1 Tax=Phycomyces blakesleeanus (strain ATCC 8743b / DSM 1359 / FGSC 10004 / NBRC 33097 / NRRL 1555) TaxID=763407 RepID=A0A162TK57_PHYB8|nr:hypothetical protein PHYBLDRAFT_174091 [Phycomyces blakesleeanus NRRL 1555(-)]OAD67773.1 hypothetical protein PHYBLDRAFT_174091 [Phycomyces blakesleeanus NRRL 1555(-)]|eukprot:XP_018285813.1 hypothetical protein PHYBLDRAFT_174091 [Phycomyces blakesleeanus NRRL 1555(-)]
MNPNAPSYSAATSDVNVRMMEAQVSTSREAEVNRPENTKRSYASKQKEYKDWCDEAFLIIPLENCYTVYGDKLHLFLKDCVVNRTHRRDTGKTIKSVEAFVETDVEPTDILLQRALPLMARKLIDMQNADSRFRREVLREFGVLHQKIDDLVSGRIPLWSLQEDGGERGGARSTEVQAFPVPANNSGPISQLPDISVWYRMSRDVQTMPDLWREWHVGLSGCVSVHKMETRCKRIVNLIKKYMVDNSVSEETAVELAEENQRTRRRTLDFLSKNSSQIFQ